MNAMVMERLLARKRKQLAKVQAELDELLELLKGLESRGARK